MAPLKQHACPQISAFYKECNSNIWVFGTPCSGKLERKIHPIIKQKIIPFRIQLDTKKMCDGKATYEMTVIAIRWGINLFCP